MSARPRDNLYLGDILEAIQRVLEYTKGLSYEEFLKHPMVQDAVLRNIQVIGEATKKLSEELQDSQPAVPWREMAGMRDKIVHDYFGVNFRVVWDVVQKDLPAVLSLIRPILPVDHESEGE
jgi:uncharacterized protein with HEPN domain